MSSKVPYRLLAAVGLAAFTATQSVADDTYLLKRVYRAGEVEKFKTTLNIESGMEAGAQQVKLLVTILGSDTVKEVKSDGSVVLETKLEKSTLTVGGNERELPGSGQTLTTVLDKDGVIVPDKNAAPGERGPAQMLAFTRAHPFPDKSLKVGDEHKFERETKDDGKVVSSVKGTMTLVGFERQSVDVPADSVKVKVVVDATVPAQEGTQKIHIDGHYWVESGTGRVVAQTGKVTGFKLPTLGDATLEFKRVRVGAAGPKATTR
jgi:hypothetical protein